MKPELLSRRRSGRSIESGFSLIELMIAVTIGLFISAALGAVFINTKSAFSSQDQLAQLEDNERLAMTLLTSSIQAAGFFPNPNQFTRVQALPAYSVPNSTAQFLAGQGIAGVSGGANGVGEVLATQFAALSTDLQSSCLGDSATSATVPTVIASVFSVSATNDLQCTVYLKGSLTPTPAGTNALVSGVKSFTVLYGVDAAGTGGNSATQYMAASSMTGLWKFAKTAQITINFVNPYGTQPITWVTTVSLMNGNQ
ncbi:MAG TPA: PilW family protein [Burkholderiaceae bacterium]|jgi:type IV pilus assembly protein PilW